MTPDEALQYYQDNKKMHLKARQALNGMGISPDTVPIITGVKGDTITFIRGVSTTAAGKISSFSNLAAGKPMTVRVGGFLCNYLINNKLLANLPTHKVGELSHGLAAALSEEKVTLVFPTTPELCTEMLKVPVATCFSLRKRGSTDRQWDIYEDTGLWASSLFAYTQKRDIQGVYITVDGKPVARGYIRTRDGVSQYNLQYGVPRYSPRFHDALQKKGYKNVSAYCGWIISSAVVPALHWKGEILCPSPIANCLASTIRVAYDEENDQFLLGDAAKGHKDFKLKYWGAEDGWMTL